MNIVDTIEGKDGYKIRIQFDEDRESPRTAFDNFGTLCLSHRKYDVANETEIKFRDHNGWEAVKKAIIKEHGSCIILPVYMYDHGGVALNTVREGVFADRWDSGVLGFIFVSHKTIRETFSMGHVSKKALAKSHAILVEEVKTYGDFLSGFVYGYDILDANFEETGTSSWGFYGNDHEKSGLMEAARSSIDEVIGSIEKPDAIQVEMDLA